MGISFNAASLLSGNGIDVNSVVSEIQAAQSGQVKAWQGDVTNLQTQATAINNINTDLSNLASAVQGLSNGALAKLTAGLTGIGDCDRHGAKWSHAGQLQRGGEGSSVCGDFVHGRGSERDYLGSSQRPDHREPYPC